MGKDSAASAEQTVVAVAQSKQKKKAELAAKVMAEHKAKEAMAMKAAKEAKMHSKTVAPSAASTPQVTQTASDAVPERPAEFWARLPKPQSNDTTDEELVKPAAEKVDLQSTEQVARTSSPFDTDSFWRADSGNPAVVLEEGTFAATSAPAATNPRSWSSFFPCAASRKRQPRYYDSDKYALFPTFLKKPVFELTSIVAF